MLPDTRKLRSSLAMLLFVGTTVAGLVLDLWTKWLAVRHLKPGRVIEFIPGWLHFTYTENQGAVFGLGQGQRWLFVGVSVAAIAFLTFLFLHSDRQRFYQFLLGLLLAGVLGNMYDRVVYGHVRDMIHALPGIYWPPWIARHLPVGLGSSGVFPWIFNIADSLLCVGVFLMIVYSFLHRPVEQRQEIEPQMNTDGHS
jgi:signal peptidase II